MGPITHDQKNSAAADGFRAAEEQVDSAVYIACPRVSCKPVSGALHTEGAHAHLHTPY